MKTQQPVEAKGSGLSSRDELIFLFLQFQRGLVLLALSFYQFVDQKLKAKNSLRIGPHILDIEDPEQISAYLIFLNSLKSRKLIGLAQYLHQSFDRSRRLKDFTITILLYLRFISRALRPRNRYGPYDEWVKKLDSPSQVLVHQWAKDMSASEVLTIVILPRALKKTADLIFSLNAQKEFKISWIFYGAAEDLENLRQAMKLNQFDVASPQFKFIVEKNFAQDLLQAVQAAGSWILFQNELGRLAMRSAHEIFMFSQTSTGSELAFADSDFLENGDSRFHPKFYPQWDLRYFFGQNCFRGLGLVSKKKLLEVMSEEKTWPELLIRLIFSTDETKISHLPKILFHSRELRDPYQGEIQKLAAPILDKSWGARLEVSASSLARIVWPLPLELPKVSILIPTKDRIDLVGTLVEGILKRTDYPNLEIVIVDNRSTEQSSHDYFAKIQKNKNVKVVSFDFPFNYSAINNYGAKFCNGEILALLNNDIEVINPHWLKEMVREALAPGVGIVGAKLYYKNGFIQHAGVALGSGQNPGHIHGFEHKSANGFGNRLRFPHELSAVTAACMLMKREVFQKVGGFNEKDLAVAYNDIDLCLRVGEMGLKIVWTPFAELYHLESASRPMDRQVGQIVRYRQELEFMRKRWAKIMTSDPHYNPNFAKGRFNFTVSVQDA